MEAAMQKRTGIQAIRDLLSSGDMSCVELTQQYLDAIERHNAELNAYVNVTGEQALVTARQVDKKRQAGEVLAPLEGIPMTLKDNISTTGIETTCCSNILKGYKPIYDATVWELLTAPKRGIAGKNQYG